VANWLSHIFSSERVGITSGREGGNSFYMSAMTMTKAKKNVQSETDFNNLLLVSFSTVEFLMEILWCIKRTIISRLMAWWWHLKIIDILLSSFSHKNMLIISALNNLDNCG
jgi:hypothetical protein